MSDIDAPDARQGEAPPGAAAAGDVSAPPAQRSSALVGVRRVEAVVNSASGSTGAGAAEALKAALAARGFEADVADCQPSEISAALKAAVDAKPDLLIVLAGDGTARLACELAGPDGPLVACLPGGTMNMLPFALYGRKPWREALEAMLDRGVEKPVSAGTVAGQLFFVAAIIGAPTLMARAREAMRAGKLRRAWIRARVALRGALTRRLRFTVDGGRQQRAQAISIMCPLVSRVMDDDVALDVAVLRPHGLGDVLRLGARTLLTDVLGDWREDAAVDAVRARTVRLRARRSVPATIDGEPLRLPADAVVRFKPAAFRALALPDVDGAAAAAPERRAEQLGAQADVAAVVAAGGAKTAAVGG